MSDNWYDEVKQKTYDSTPITSEEMREVQHNLFDDDVIGGLHNINVTEAEMERIHEQETFVRSFVDIKEEHGSLCYRTDQVHLKMTAEQLFVLSKALETLSLDMTHIDYLYEEKGMKDLYEQQSYIRHLRDIVDGTVNEYVVHRPYSPFLPSWAKKIGKEKVRKK